MDPSPWYYQVCETGLSGFLKCRWRAKTANLERFFCFFLAISANVSSAQMLVRGLASIKMYLGPFWNASKSETVLCGGVQSLPK
jgi:hypothetical protein